MEFKSVVLDTRAIKINGKIKKAIQEYNRWKVPMKVLLTNFLAVKSKGDLLAEAENPWAYFYKGIEGHEVESGVSVDETLFRFVTMEMKDQKPSDVINAAFFSNKKRNDSEFELGFLLPLFEEKIRTDDAIIIVNPSPDMICAVEGKERDGKRCYVVSDNTIAGLYRIQFPGALFYAFDEISEADIDADAILMVNRDQLLNRAQLLLQCLKKCKDNAFVLGLVPSAWLDNSRSGAYAEMSSNGYAVKQILIVDSKSTQSTPRKKMVLALDKFPSETIKVQQSSYNPVTKAFTVGDDIKHISAQTYLKTDKTILNCWNEYDILNQGKTVFKYKKAEEYKFSEEISLFYKVYSGRKNKFAGVAYYREIKDVENKIWGKKVSPDIEKGLRADSAEKVIGALSDIVFDDNIYPVIRFDIEKTYIATKRNFTLKTIWLYCWCYVVNIKEYDHEYICQLFADEKVARVFPQIQEASILLNAIAQSMNIDIEQIPYKTIAQLELILKSAVKHHVLLFDFLEPYVADYTRRATERQQDIRNALVKKHFSEEEELRIFEGIIEIQKQNGLRRYKCTEKSILLATAIRIFTGMSIRETAALKWEDFKCISRGDSYQFLITKFVDEKGNIILHSKRENWKRFRVVPIARVLTLLLIDRKNYLIEQGVEEEYLQNCPIILQEERIADMKNKKKIGHCKPSKISKSSNELIKLAHIPENEMILPDDQNDLISDFNRYHGDIFLSNFRHKANHDAFMTMGEMNYMIGVDAPDTFSRHYCDFTNDFIQEGIIQKLCRWEAVYERRISEKRFPLPSCGEYEGNVSMKTGPYSQGLAEVDLIIENKTGKDAELVIQCIHGANVTKSTY